MGFSSSSSGFSSRPETRLFCEVLHNNEIVKKDASKLLVLKKLSNASKKTIATVRSQEEKDAKVAFDGSEAVGKEAAVEDVIKVQQTAMKKLERLSASGILTCVTRPGK